MERRETASEAYTHTQLVTHRDSQKELLLEYRGIKSLEQGQCFHHHHKASNTHLLTQSSGSPVTLKEPPFLKLWGGVHHFTIMHPRHQWE